MKQVSAKDIAQIINGEIKGNCDILVNSVASLKDATNEQVSFLGNKKYHEQLKSSQAGIVLISKEFENEDSNGKTFIVCDNVDIAFSKVIMIFAPEAKVYPREIHVKAAVASSAKIGKNVHIGANAVVDENAEIGDNSVICAGVYVGSQVKIGENCMLYPNSTVMDRCILGDRVVLQPGVVIGGDGFGFLPTPNGIVKIPQIGIVQIDNDVEIGANTTIDRARFGKTWLKSGVKIDNQVMVAHNVVVGENSILIAQCGIAGSAEIGRGVILAAKSGINGHITVGDGCQVAGTSSVPKSLPAGTIAIGTPAESQREFMARYTLPSRFEKLKTQVNELKAQIAELLKK